jgi:predicted GNAT family acetyltransferase
MTNDTQAVDVRHETDRHRFVTLVDGVEGELEYRREAGRLLLTHTHVPTEIGGRGIAAELTRQALAFARAEGLKVVPVCSYAATYFRRHPEHADLLAG